MNTPLDFEYYSERLGEYIDDCRFDSFDGDSGHYQINLAISPHPNYADRLSGLIDTPAIGSSQGIDASSVPADLRDKLLAALALEITGLPYGCSITIDIKSSVPGIVEQLVPVLDSVITGHCAFSVNGVADFPVRALHSALFVGSHDKVMLAV